jgi:hypothetical protein
VRQHGPGMSISRHSARDVSRAERMVRRAARSAHWLRAGARRPEHSVHRGVRSVRGAEHSVRPGVRSAGLRTACIGVCASARRAAHSVYRAVRKCAPGCAQRASGCAQPAPGCARWESGCARCEFARLQQECGPRSVAGAAGGCERRESRGDECLCPTGCGRLRRYVCRVLGLHVDDGAADGDAAVAGDGLDGDAGVVSRPDVELRKDSELAVFVPSELPSGPVRS